MSYQTLEKKTFFFEIIVLLRLALSERVKKA